MKKIIITFGALLVLFSSCSEYSKVLKGNDNELKYEKAIEYYNEGRCYQALPLFDELIGLMRNTERAEEVYYYFAQSHYCIGDYYLSNYYFKSFIKTFPQSQYAEECQFLIAMCSYNLSPKYSLDQTDTKSAIDDFQLFMDRYPQSELRDSCNTMIFQLRDKLEVKSFEIAELYLKTEKYRAAVLAYENAMLEYPDSQFREKILFGALKSNYLYAEGSILSKKTERYKETIDRYYKFVSAFPGSKLLKEAESYFDKSVDSLEKLGNTNTQG